MTEGKAQTYRSVLKERFVKLLEKESITCYNK